MFLHLIQSITSDAWAVFLIILFFGGSIFVHELGHFLVARRRGVHVERFSIGFGPKICAWHGKDGVEYRLSWLPLGGYVLLPQLADLGGIEGESAVDVAVLPPVKYLDKMLVFVAGAACNVLFAFLLATVIWVIGFPAQENITTTRIGYVAPTVKLPDGRKVPSPALSAGLKVNDIIRSVDGRSVSAWPDVVEGLVLGTGVEPDGQRVARLTIERAGSTREIVVHPLRLGDEQMRKIGIAAAYAVIVEKITPDSPAGTLGLRAGDRFQSIDGTPVTDVEIVSEYVAEHPGKGFALVVGRNGTDVRLTAPDRDPKAPHAFFGVVFVTNYQLLYQDPWSLCSQIVDSTFRTLWSLISPNGDVKVSDLNSPIGIGIAFWRAAHSDYPIRFLIWFTVLLNLNLAIFNLLPIPLLDGGQMVIATIGRLRSRALPANLIAATLGVSMVLLLSLVLYVGYNEVLRIRRDNRADRAETEQSSAPASQKTGTAPAAR